MVMGKTRTIGLALAAMFAVGLIAVASASALPEFKTTTFPVTFTSANELPLEPNLVGKVLGVTVTITCKMSADTGEVSAATGKVVKKVKVTYTECKLGMAACTSPSQVSGTIVTKELEGTLGYIDKTTKEVGIELKPVSGEFAKFTCTGTPEAIVTGCTIGIAGPINVLQSTGNLSWENNGTTTQTETKLEGGAACELSTFTAKSALMDNELETFSKAVELKA